MVTIEQDGVKVEAETMAAAKRALKAETVKRNGIDAIRKANGEIADRKAESNIARIVRGNAVRWTDLGTEYINTHLRFDGSAHVFVLDHAGKHEFYLGHAGTVVRAIIDMAGIVAMKVRDQEGETWYAVGMHEGEVGRERIKTGNACGDAVRAALEAIPVDMGV